MFAIEKWLRKLNVIYLRMQRRQAEANGSKLIVITQRARSAKPGKTNLTKNSLTAETKATNKTYKGPDRNGNGNIA